MRNRLAAALELIVMPTRRPLWLALGAVTLVTAVPAAAASLGGVAPDPVAADTATVAACDDAVSVDHTTEGGNVTQVTVGGIADPGCEGGLLTVTLTSNGTSAGSGGPAVIAVDADTTNNAQTLTISPTPAAGDVTGASIQIVGPGA